MGKRHDDLGNLVYIIQELNQRGILNIIAKAFAEEFKKPDKVITQLNNDINTSFSKEYEEEALSIDDRHLTINEETVRKVEKAIEDLDYLIYKNRHNLMHDDLISMMNILSVIKNFFGINETEEEK